MSKCAMRDAASGTPCPEPAVYEVTGKWSGYTLPMCAADTARARAADVVGQVRSLR